MLRIVYNPADLVIITVISNSPEMGTTYTPFPLMVCSEEEALIFFAGYPQEEIDKITNPDSPSAVGTIESAEI